MSERLERQLAEMEADRDQWRARANAAERRMVDQDIELEKGDGCIFIGDERREALRAIPFAADDLSRQLALDRVRIKLGGEEERRRIARRDGPMQIETRRLDARTTGLQPPLYDRIATWSDSADAEGDVLADMRNAVDVIERDQREFAAERRRRR